MRYRCILKGGSQNGREVEMPYAINAIHIPLAAETNIVFDESQEFAVDVYTGAMAVDIPVERYVFVGYWSENYAVRVYECQP